jgi:hypothetical protein
LALICGLAICLDLPALIPATIIPFLAWYTWRIDRVSTPGMVFCVLSLELVTGIVALAYHSHGNIFDLIPITILFFAASGCMIASIAAFLGFAYVRRVQIRQNLLAALAALLFPVLWFAIGVPGANMLSELALHCEIARRGVPTFVDDVTELTQRLDRAPKDEAELVRLLGKPMPRLSWGQISYESWGGKQFTLGFGFDAGCYEFDSEHPGRGWHLYGAEEHAVFTKRFYAAHPEIVRPAVRGENEGKSSKR